MRTLIRTPTPCCHRNALCIRLYSSTRAPRLPQWPSSTNSFTLTTVITGTSRRHFITLPKLPKLPNLLNPLSSSRHYKDRTLLKYSQQEFYDLVANVDDYHKFLPWCTYSKMSAPLPLGSESVSGSKRTGSEERKKKASDALVGLVKGGGEVTVRHGELGIGFNSLQERYVSTVTCQEPWMVRAVSYDSKLFKELSTTWRFTPNIPKTTTLEATMDQEVQEFHLLTRPAAEDDHEREPVITVSSTMQEKETEEVSQQPSFSISTPAAAIVASKVQEQPKHYFTAAAVFGEAALPRPRTTQSASPPLSSLPSPSLPSPFTAPSTNISTGGHSASTIKESSVTSPDPATTATLPTPPSQPSQPLRSSFSKQVILQRTASPSNLATMRPCDYPSVWIDFEIEFEFASPVHASMSSLFFDQVSKEMLAAFVKRAEVLYGQR
ncbi:Coenzyme Q-binding protein coq10a, mitochondrial [Haplosporangium gracile]|nr:Coenzyme Q-binding protein coq10a, mitochondrial [Haplosporangium gracile]